MQAFKNISLLVTIGVIVLLSVRVNAQENETELLELVDSLFQNRHHEEMIILLNQEIYEDKKFPDQKIFLLERLTQSYIYIGKYAHAKVLWNKLNGELGEVPSKSKARIRLIKATIHYYEHEIDSAYVASKEAKELYAAINDTMGIMTCSGNIGALLTVRGKHEEALTYLKTAIKLAESRKILRYELYLNTALCYGYLDSIDLQFNYFEHSLQVARKHPRKHNEIFQSFYHVALAHNKMGNILKTKQYLDTCEYYITHPIQHELKDLYYDLRISNNTLLDQTNSVESLFVKKEEASNSFISNNQITDINEIRVTLEKEALVIKEEQKSQNKENLLALKLLLLTLTIVSFLALFTYKIFKIKKRKLSLELSIIQTKQKLLKAQLSPEFVINSISTIKRIINKGDNKLAADYLSKFSKLIRQILENSREKYTSLESEMSTLTKYLQLKQIEKQNTFDFKLKIDRDMDQSDIYIPPMMLQPFVDQIIKLNEVSPNSYTQNIEIQLYEKDGILDCEISNISESNPVQFNKADILKSKSVKTVHQRLISLSEEIGKNSSIQIDQIKNSNLSRILLQIPFKVNLN